MFLALLHSGIVITAIGLIVVKLISVFTGLIMFAKYHDCDPFLTKVQIHDIPKYSRVLKNYYNV